MVSKANSRIVSQVYNQPLFKENIIQRDQKLNIAIIALNSPFAVVDDALAADRPTAVLDVEKPKHRIPGVPSRTGKYSSVVGGNCCVDGGRIVRLAALQDSRRRFVEVDTLILPWAANPSAEFVLSPRPDLVDLG